MGLFSRKNDAPSRPSQPNPPMTPTCTYCGGTKFFEGPSGGMSTNILCANPACRHWFNFAAGLQFDDLNRVEPTQAEKAAEQTTREIAAADAAESRREEGRAAFREGRGIDSLRTDRPYGGYAEATKNMDRIAGFIDEMADYTRSRDKEGGR